MSGDCRRQPLNRWNGMEKEKDRSWGTNTNFWLFRIIITKLWIKMTISLVDPTTFSLWETFNHQTKKQIKQKKKKTFPPHRDKHIWFQKWRDEKWQLSSDFLDTQPDLSEKDSTKRKIRVRNKTNTKEKRQKSDSSRQSGSPFFFLYKTNKKQKHSCI